MRYRLPRGWPLVSWIVLVLASLAAASAARDATIIDPLPSPSALTPNDYSVVLAGDSVAFVTTERLPNDPFRPGRLLPEAIAAAAAAPDTVLPVSVAAIRLLGTVLRPTGGFALCQLPGEVPRIVHVGERLGELTLVVLEQGHVVFEAPKGARLQLALSQPRS